MGLVILLAVFNITVFSQASETPLTKTFSSFEGGYIVELPWTAGPAGSATLGGTETYALGSGRSFRWSAGGVLMETAFVVFDRDSKVPRDPLDTFYELVRRSGEFMEADGGELVIDRAVIARGGAGRELVFESGNNRQIARWFFHEGRAVRVSAEFAAVTGAAGGDENQRAAERFLDSVQLKSRDEIAAIKIKEAAPAELPQAQPRLPARWLRPDAEEMAKDRVKSIFEEIENTGKDAAANGIRGIQSRQKKIDHYFDPQGFLTRTVSYDFTGFPEAITAYGFIDGKRVNKNAYVPGENVATAMGLPVPAQSVKKRDTRYSTRVEEKYDANKRLAERTFYDNAGDLFLRAVYSYRDNRIEIYEYKKTGTLENKFSQVLDQKGNLAQKTAQSFGHAPNERKYVYKYLTFDDRGNWTKRTVSLEIKENGKITTLEYIEYRKLAYY